MRSMILVAAVWAIVHGVVAGQAASAQSPSDGAPRQAPGSIDRAPPPSPPSGSSESLGQFSPVAPPPAPFGSAGPVPSPVVAAQPLPPGFWLPTNPAGQQRGWLQGEFLLWWIKPGPNPTPLATNGDLADPVPGGFGQPGTTAVLLGGQNLNYNPAAGMRFSGGYWFGDAARWGLDASIFFLNDQTLHRGVISDDGGNPGIYRPVNDVNFGETALFVAVPGMASGAILVSSRSELWGADLNGLYRLVQRDSWNFNVLAGFKFLDLHETLNISAFTNDFAGVLPGPFTGDKAEVPGTNVLVFDGFQTRNQFYGGQVGFQTSWAFAPRWYLSARAQVGLGETHQTINISGSTVQDQPGIGVAAVPAGALATASNSGHFTHDAFSVVPEAQLKVGYQFSRYFSGFIGYNFLYWSNVVRAGNEISRTVDLQGVPTSGVFNPAVVTTAPAPPSFVQTGFWAQGINFGLQFSY
jgi:hypothetical protein